MFKHWFCWKKINYEIVDKIIIGKHIVDDLYIVGHIITDRITEENNALNKKQLSASILSVNSSVIMTYYRHNKPLVITSAIICILPIELNLQRITYNNSKYYNFCNFICNCQRKSLIIFFLTLWNFMGDLVCRSFHQYCITIFKICK